MRQQRILGVAAWLGAGFCFWQLARGAGQPSFATNDYFSLMMGILLLITSPKRYLLLALLVLLAHVYLHFVGLALETQALFLIENVLVAGLAIPLAVNLHQGRLLPALKLEPRPLVVLTARITLLAICLVHLTMDLLWLALQRGWLDELTTGLWLMRLEFGAAGVVLALVGVCALRYPDVPATAWQGRHPSGRDGPAGR